MSDEELIARLRAWDGTPFDDDAEAAADRIEQLADELHTIKTGGIIEVANRNNRVTEYMFYWEGRALDAEARVERLEAALREIADRDYRLPTPREIARAALKGDDHE